MFILLFIVLRHQYLCSAAWTVCSYTSNASSATSNMAEPPSLCVCVCSIVARVGACVCVCVCEGSHKVLRIRLLNDAGQDCV